MIIELSILTYNYESPDMHTIYQTYRDHAGNLREVAMQPTIKQYDFRITETGHSFRTQPNQLTPSVRPCGRAGCTTCEVFNHHD
jgi:hypothetical protein